MPWPITEPPKEEEFQPAVFLFSFEVFNFEDYGNTSNDFKQKRRPIPVTPNPLKDEFLKETIKESTTIPWRNLD